MSNIPETHPISSNPNKEDFKEMLASFEKNLKAYQQCSSAGEKASFKNALDTAYKTLTQQGFQHLNSSDREHLIQLQTDFKAFTNNPSSELMKKLQSDINALKEAAA
jgi:pyruvate-formate lyase